ncbi:hypothetical protein [Bradyrhizobium sp. SRS-191]|uniref:hypothetical protein n=1 Tax=Bradyrhizobium sp. SRS-191 TaxID=2962606 RepID=UPI00211E3A40|nr:hypothetical protein [Bradyrhizobium sp. SRS-191]
MTTRRNFLGLLAAAPLLPAAAKAANVLTESPHLGGYAVPRELQPFVGELVCGESVLTHSQYLQLAPSSPLPLRERVAPQATGEGYLSAISYVDVYPSPDCDRGQDLAALSLKGRGRSNARLACGTKPGVGDHTPELLAPWEIAS